MIEKPSPFKGLNIRSPITIPVKGKGFINQGSGLREYDCIGSLSPYSH